MKQFQVFLWKNGYPRGVGGASPRVVAFIVSSDSEDFPREAEKIAKKSRAEKIAAGKSRSGRVRPDARSRCMLDASPFPFSMPDSEGVGSCKSPRVCSSPTANALTRHS